MASSLNTAYLVLTGVVILAVAAVFALLQPMVSSIGETRTAIQARQAELSEREDFLRTLDRKIAALSGQVQHERQLNVVLPLDENSEDVLRIVHRAAAASGGTVAAIDNVSASVQGAVNSRRARGDTGTLPDDVNPLAFAIEFTGSYQQLRVFMEDLERSPRLLDVIALEINRDPTQLDAVGADLTARFYHYQPQL